MRRPVSYVLESGPAKEVMCVINMFVANNTGNYEKRKNPENV